MNVFKIAYCRIFQAVMRTAIPFLPYRKPEILQDMCETAQVLKQKNIDNVFIVTGEHVLGRGLCGELFSELGRAGIKYSVYSKTKPNPSALSVEEAREQYLSDGCKAIIAFGGGSPIDLAKACGARIVKPKSSLNDLAGLMRVRKKLPPLFAIPTTAGTGSETTVASVITDKKTHRKFVINDFSLIPHFAVLDYRLTLGLPADVTAHTGMDALTHAVEAFIGRATTKKTRKAAIEAVKLIKENLTICYNEPENAEARKNMLFASHLAGLAFTKSYVGYVHAVGHSISGRYNTAHGLTCAVLLPAVLEAYGKKAHKKLKKLAVCTGIAYEADKNDVASRKFIEWIYSMNAQLNIPKGFDCIDKNDIPKMAEYAEREGNPLYPVPKLMDKKQLTELYLAVSL